MSQINQFITTDEFIKTLIGDAGAAVSADATGELYIAGGAGIVTTGTPASNTLTIDAAASVPTTFNADAGSAVPALNAITMTGGTNINTSGAGAVVTFNLDATITLTTVNATTFDTNVAAAGVTLSGTSLLADGTDANIDINITSKGTGQVIIDDLNISGLTAGTLRSSGTGDVSSLADGADGTLLIGKTGDVPIWATLTDGNNITATEGANSISIAVTGTTQYAVQVGDATGSLDSLATGTAGQVLQSGGAAANPAWSTAIYPVTAAIGTILIASGANTITTLAPDTAGYVLTDGGAGVAPSWVAPTVGTVTSVTGGTNISTSGTGAAPIIDLDAAITAMTSVTFSTGGSLQTGTTATNSLLIQAYDVDGTAYVPFITLTAADDPTCDLATGVTIGTKYIYRADGTDVPIADGGTNASSMTNTYGVNYFDGTSIVTTTVGTATHILTSNGVGVAPTFQAAPAGVTYCDNAEAIAGTVTDEAVSPSTLKAKLGAQTSHGLPYGAATTGAIAWTAEPSDGQILIGDTGNVPQLATLTAGSGISIANAAHSITITGGAATLNDQTGTTYTLVLTDAGKFITFTNGAAITVTVPTNAAVAFPIGTQIGFQQGGAGQVTFSGAVPPTLKSADDAYTTLKLYSVGALIKIAEDVWAIAGDMEA